MYHIYNSIQFYDNSFSIIYISFVVCFVSRKMTIIHFCAYVIFPKHISQDFFKILLNCFKYYILPFLLYIISRSKRCLKMFLLNIRISFNFEIPQYLKSTYTFVFAERSEIQQIDSEIVTHKFPYNDYWFGTISFKW
jgi:hypothetical protein